MDLRIETRVRGDGKRWRPLVNDETIGLMRRKKKGVPAGAAAAPAKSFVNRPFRGLEVATSAASPRVPSEPRSGPTEPSAQASDADLFSVAMAGVDVLSSKQPAVVPPPIEPTRRRPVEDPDAEAFAELSDLVSGSGVFDITDTTEFLEGAASGVDSGLVRRLRRGEFAFRRHLDLHGMTVAEAHDAVDGFLRSAVQSEQRCVLIVHGRGLNSPDKVPVLKRHLVDWISRGTWARRVLAFTSARPCDGGAGATYVLMRRNRAGKKQIRVTEGAKW